LQTRGQSPPSPKDGSGSTRARRQYDAVEPENRLSEPARTCGRCSPHHRPRFGNANS
jgi:hypothetical protein